MLLRHARRPATLAATRLGLRRTLATEVQPSSGTELQVTDPIELYRGLVAQGKVRYDPEQMRALLQVSRRPSALEQS